MADAPELISAWRYLAPAYGTHLAEEHPEGGWRVPDARVFEMDETLFIRKDVSDTRIAELEAELDHFKNSGIIEVAVRNPSVSEYMSHWEGRAEKSEARIAELEAENERLRDCRKWRFYPIEMPLSADGQGPATVGVDAASISYEVWDELYNSYSTHDNLPDAINDAMTRCAALNPRETDK